MPTLDDLRDVLDYRAGGCGDTPLAVPAPDARRRVLQPLLASAAVLAAVAVGVVLSRPASEPLPSGGSAALPPTTGVRWQFAIGRVPGWTSSRDDASWTSTGSRAPGGWSEAAVLTATTGRATLTYGYVPRGTVAFPGNGVGSQLKRAQAVTVHGRSGWFVPGTAVDTGGQRSTGSTDPWKAVQNSGDWQPQLAWRNGDGSWSSLSGTVGFRPSTLDFDNTVARREMLRVAAAVRLTPHGDRVTMPFAVVDARLRPIEVTTFRGASCVAWATATKPLPGNNASVTMCRLPSAGRHDPNVPQGAIVRDLHDGSLLVVGNLNGGVDEAAARHLLATAEVRPQLTRRSTWLPVA